MQNIIRVILAAIMGFFIFDIAIAIDQQQIGRNGISGDLVQGYRVLPLKNGDQDIIFNVYRGDYIKFDFDLEIQNPMLEIPALSVKQRLSNQIDDAPYFKMKNAGRYRFLLGGVNGHIQVVEYRQPYYREVDSKQAAQILKNLNPFLLDVRTRGEFNRGHIPNAKLIPVQELQRRYVELAAHKHSDILIYCATGNRSTVASKILIDNGFKRIINMRYGIAQWTMNKYPVQK